MGNKLTKLKVDKLSSQLHSKVLKVKYRCFMSSILHFPLSDLINHLSVSVMLHARNSH